LTNRQLPKNDICALYCHIRLYFLDIVQLWIFCPFVTNYYTFLLKIKTNKCIKFIICFTECEVKRVRGRRYALRLACLGNVSKCLSPYGKSKQDSLDNIDPCHVSGNFLPFKGKSPTLSQGVYIIR
jgi:hypothetical protein